MRTECLNIRFPGSLYRREGEGKVELCVGYSVKLNKNIEPTKMF